MSIDEPITPNNNNTILSPPLPVIIKKNGAILWGKNERSDDKRKSCLCLHKRPEMGQSQYGNRYPSHSNYVSRFPYYNNSYWYYSFNLPKFSMVMRYEYGNNSSSTSLQWFDIDYESEDKTLVYHKLLKRPRFETLKVPNIIHNQEWSPDNSKNELPKEQDETDKEYKKRIKDNSGKEELLSFSLEDEERAVFYCDCTTEWDLTFRNYDTTGDGTKENPWKNFFFAFISIIHFKSMAFGDSRIPKICLKTKGNANFLLGKHKLINRIFGCYQKTMGYNSSWSSAYYDRGKFAKDIYFTSWGNEPYSLKFIADTNQQLNLENCIFENANISCLNASLEVDPGVTVLFAYIKMFYKCTINNFECNGPYYTCDHWTYHCWFTPYKFFNDGGIAFCESTLYPNVKHTSRYYEPIVMLHKIKNSKVIFPNIENDKTTYSYPTFMTDVTDGLTIITPTSTPYGIHILADTINNLNAANIDQTLLFISCGTIANSLYSVVLKEYLPWINRNSFDLYSWAFGYTYTGHGFVCEEMYNVKVNVTGSPYRIGEPGRDNPAGVDIQQFKVECSGTIEKCTFNCNCNEVMKDIPTFNDDYPDQKHWDTFYRLAFSVLSAFTIRSRYITDSIIELSSTFNFGEIKRTGDNCSSRLEYHGACGKCEDQYAVPAIGIRNQVYTVYLTNTKIINNVSSTSNSFPTIKAAIVANSSFEINSTSDYWYAGGGVYVGVYMNIPNPNGAICNVNVTKKSIPWYINNGGIFESWHRAYFAKDRWPIDFYSKSGVASWTVPNQKSIDSHCNYLKDLYEK